MRLRLLVHLVVINCIIGFLIAGTGCISASSSTGADASAEIKSKQSSSQSSTNSDMVRLEVAPTTITAPDGSVITIGGAKAETGSKTSNEQDQISKISAKADAMAKA